MSEKSLILIPTYNERENVARLITQILNLGLENTEILFIDDNSPDGTGTILEGYSELHGNIQVLHRPVKLGIGSAHLEGIKWAYDGEYDILITMDSDFTHPPSYIRQLINASSDCDLVVASRYLEKNSLEAWSLLRKSLTLIGHFITSFLLKVDYDTTGAFRLYRLSNIPKGLFTLIKSDSYFFFIESLFILNNNNFSIKEIPIKLPARTSGHSKMKFSDGLRTVASLLLLCCSTYLDKDKFKIPKPYSPSDV